MKGVIIMYKTKLNFVNTSLFILFGLCFFIYSIHAEVNKNTIMFENKSGQPILVKLIGSTVEFIEFPYKSSRSVSVKSGAYYFLVRYGSKPSEYLYEKYDSFTVTQSEKQNSAITVRFIKKVIGGKAKLNVLFISPDNAILQSNNSTINSRSSFSQIKDNKSVVGIKLGLTGSIGISISRFNSYVEDYEFKKTFGFSTSLHLQSFFRKPGFFIGLEPSIHFASTKFTEIEYY